MKKIYLLFTLLLISFSFAQDINFPDPVFKNMLLSSRGYYTSLCNAKDFNGNYIKLDANNDGEIQVAEAQNAYTLEVWGNSTIHLTSLSGIESFSNVKRLLLSSGNYLDAPAELNLTTLPQLEWLGIYSFKNLKKLNISTAVNLKDLIVRDTGIDDFNMGTISNIERMEFSHSKITALNLAAFGNLVALNCKANPISNLVLPAAKNLVDLDCSSTEITSLNLAGFTKLKNLNCRKGQSDYPSYYTPVNKISSFDISSCTNLEKIECSQNAISALNLENYTKLKFLNCERNKLTLLNVNGCTELEILYLNIQNVLDLDTPSFGAEMIFTMNGCIKIKILELNFVPIKNLNAEGCIALEKVTGYKSWLENANFKNCNNLLLLNIYDTNLAVLNIEGCTKLEYINCINNKLVSLDASGATALQNITADNNLLESINVSGCNNLSSLSVSQNKLQQFVLQNLPVLSYLRVDHNLLTSVDLNNLTSLSELNLDHNQLSSFQLNNLPALYKLILSNNLFTDLSFPAAMNISNIDVSNNSFTSLNFDNLPNLSIYTDISTAGNPYSSLNFSKNSVMELLQINSETLTNLFIKNNSAEYIDGQIPNLKYVCCDDRQISTLQDSMINLGASNVSVNSYCSFNPGGNYNTISGKVRFDENNNGCDSSDGIFEHLKLKISDGTNSGETFTDKEGNYKFFTQAGDFIITSEPENAPLFTVSPGSFNTAFADDQNNIFNQNICVSVNGNAADLEVVIAPVAISRPGFNGIYQLILRNKGNQTLSGTADFNFENTKMSYISSSVVPNSVSANQLLYNFTNLKPFESRAIEIKFLVNKPTDPFPVNVGDELRFEASINPVSGDILPNDNHFVYNETVIGAIDPNDIVCLEGNIVPKEKIGDYLHYTVNFENTGTAPAENVVIEMNVNAADFEISTLQLQNSSAPSYSKIEGQKAEFILENIQLPVDAHGNIQVKIKTKSTKIPGDQVSLGANIYFDYNLPVATNEAVTKFDQVLASQDTNGKSGIQIYPNPTAGPMNIKAKEEIKSISLYDQSGRLLQTQILSAKEETFDLSRRSAGIYYLMIKTKENNFLEKIIKK